MDCSAEKYIVVQLTLHYYKYACDRNLGPRWTVTKAYLRSLGVATPRSHPYITSSSSKVFKSTNRRTTRFTAVPTHPLSIRRTYLQWLVLSLTVLVEVEVYTKYHINDQIITSAIMRSVIEMVQSNRRRRSSTVSKSGLGAGSDGGHVEAARRYGRSDETIHLHEQRQSTAHRSR